MIYKIEKSHFMHLQEFVKALIYKIEKLFHAIQIFREYILSTFVEHGKSTIVEEIDSNGGNKEIHPNFIAIFHTIIHNNYCF